MIILPRATAKTDSAAAPGDTPPSCSSTSRTLALEDRPIRNSLDSPSVCPILVNAAFRHREISPLRQGEQGIKPVRTIRFKSPRKAFKRPQDGFARNGAVGTPQTTERVSATGVVSYGVTDGDLEKSIRSWRSGSGPAQSAASETPDAPCRRRPAPLPMSWPPRRPLPMSAPSVNAARRLRGCRSDGFQPGGQSKVWCETGLRVGR